MSVSWASEGEVAAGVGEWRRSGLLVSDAVARVIASYWHSPRNGLAELSTAGRVSPAVAAGVEMELDGMSAVSGEDRWELEALGAWVVDRVAGGFWELSVLIDGVEDEVVYRRDEAGRDAYVDEVAGFASRCEGTVEVFALWHGHGDDGRECECVQYATDHRPLWSSDE